jgi:hypothetical protein
VQPVSIDLEDEGPQSRSGSFGECNSFFSEGEIESFLHMPMYPHIRGLFFALLKQIVGLSTEIITLLRYSDAVGSPSKGCFIERLLSIEIMAVVGRFCTYANC